ncbi:glucan endo-1,3-beta-glucosidase 7 [Citrus clementina]|uniref:glucan endo-1,3-beta-glucosidase 7 n=1 Tax=Citrus clementina TaxID=85681 RepID=UPI000CED2C3F|nr:glucan endo-1,3-beta-glucosidase 7 [Citrus x clementina]
MTKTKQLSAFVLLLLIIYLLCSPMTTGAVPPANEGELVRQFELVRASEPTRPHIIQNREHNSEQATDMLKVDGKASCEGQTTWCIVKPSTGDERLIANIQYCCDHVDCSIIQPGGACYEPNNNYSHASVVMHLFYRANNKLPHTCDFMQSGLIISQDPSVGKCIYAP